MHDRTGARQLLALGPPRWMPLLGLILSREGAALTTIVANGLLLPAFICYCAFMLSPPGDPVRVRWAIGGIVLGLGTMALNQIYFAVATDRLLGGRRLLAANGIGSGAYLAAHLAYALCLSTLVAIGGFAFLKIAGLAHGEWSAIGAVVLVCQTAGIALAGIGTVIGSTVPSFGMGDVVSNASGMLLVLLSPVFYPLDAISNWARALASLSPYTQVGLALAALVDGKNPDPLALAALAAMAAIASVAAYFALQRVRP